MFDFEHYSTNPKRKGAGFVREWLWQ